MQKDTSLPPSSTPSASKSVLGAGRQASMSGVPSNSETGYRACPKAQRKPGMSKVILRVMADKGEHNRVSLNTLKSALVATGYNMTRNAWRLKKILRGLVDKGMLKQMTGKGTLGSFRKGKKFASKIKPKAKRRPQKQQRQPGQRGAGQRQPGRRGAGQHRRPLSSKQGHKQLIKGARRVAKCRRN